MTAETIKSRYENEPDPDTPEKLFLRKELKEVIEAKLEKLEPLEQAILEMHYGLRGKSQMTLAEIASTRRLGLTLGQVAHIEKGAREKIATLTPRFRRKNKREILRLLED